MSSSAAAIRSRGASDAREVATKFVVFTTQRSGSTWVMSVLNGVEGVSAQGEVFLRRPRSPERRWDSEFSEPRYVESAASVGRLRPFSVFRYLDRLYATPGAVGFKLMYSQVKSYPEILLYLVRRRVPVVHLVRRNHLDVLISFAVKHELGRAHVLDESDRPESIQVELDAASVLRDVERLQRKHDVARRVLRLCRLRHVEVAYEDLAADPSEFERVLAFLEIPSQQALPTSNILRSRQGSQREVVQNYDEVSRVLRNGGFAPLLE